MSSKQMLKDRKKSVRFLKEYSSRWLIQIMRHSRKHERSGDISLYGSIVRAWVLSQSVTGNERVLRKCDQFCYNPPELHFLIAETSSLEFLAPDLGDLVRG